LDCKYYCEEHNKYFNKKSDYSQHMNSSSHKQITDKYYCEEHNKYFNKKSDYSQHMNSSSHKQITDKYYCEEYNKYFNKKSDYSQHMNSSSHQQITDKYYCEEYNKYFNKKSDYSQHMNSSSHQQKKGIENIPPPVESPVKWECREEFNSRKSIGYFKCSRWFKSWISAHAFKDYKQGCKECNRYVFALYLWKNDNEKKLKIIKNLKGLMIERDVKHVIMGNWGMYWLK